jgi:hypothetical protein
VTVDFDFDFDVDGDDDTVFLGCPLLQFLTLGVGETVLILVGSLKKRKLNGYKIINTIIFVILNARTDKAI